MSHRRSCLLQSDQPGSTRTCQRQVPADPKGVFGPTSYGFERSKIWTESGQFLSRPSSTDLRCHSANLSGQHTPIWPYWLLSPPPSRRSDHSMWTDEGNSHKADSPRYFLATPSSPTEPQTTRNHWHDDAMRNNITRTGGLRGHLQEGAMRSALQAASCEAARLLLTHQRKTAPNSRSKDSGHHLRRQQNAAKSRIQTAEQSAYIVKVRMR